MCLGRGGAGGWGGGGGAFYFIQGVSTWIG